MLNGKVKLSVFIYNTSMVHISYNLTTLNENGFEVFRSIIGFILRNTLKVRRTMITDNPDKILCVSCLKDLFCNARGKISYFHIYTSMESKLIVQ